MRGLLVRELPVFGLARTSLGLILLGRDGLAGFQDRMTGAVEWGGVDAPGRLNPRIGTAKARAEADLRRLALARSLRGQSANMLRKHLADGFAYLNVGHSNLSQNGLAAVRQGGAGVIAVLLHDVIPITHPDTQRPGMAAKVGRRLQAIVDHADLVIASAQSTSVEIKGALQATGPAPKVLVAPLGVDLAEADPTTRQPQSPYFLAVGTIEPRKNYAFLVQIWAELLKREPASMPRLIIAGRAGWDDGGLGDALSRYTEVARFIDLRPDLADGEIAALISGAAGLLQPSIAEGFGLPVFEAAARGTSIICSDLPVYREFLKDLPIYGNHDDPYQWATHVEQLADICIKRPAVPDGSSFRPPTWDAHLDKVLGCVTRASQGFAAG